MLTEYNSSATKSAAKEAKQDARLRKLEADLEHANEALAMQTEALRHVVAVLEKQQPCQPQPPMSPEAWSWFGFGKSASIQNAH